MKKPKRYLLTFIWTLPAALLTWLIVLVIWALWGSKLEWLEGLWCELKEDSWPMRTWYKKWGGTTFVMGGFYAYKKMGEKGKIDTKTEAHEHIHIEQAEANCLFGLLVGVVIGLVTSFSPAGVITAIITWTITPLMIYFLAGIQAVIRGESFYRGNHFEEHAYGLAKEELDKILEEARGRNEARKQI